MSEQLSFWQEYNKAVKLLDGKHLAEALKLTHRIVDKTADWQLADELESIGSAYSMLLNCLRLGMDDPDREVQHLNFICRCYDVLEKVAHNKRVKENGVALTRNMLQILKDLEDYGMKSITSHLNDSDLQKHVSLYVELFHCAKNSSVWNAEEQKVADEVMSSGLVSNNDKSVMLSALLLSCLNTFDPQKIIFFVKQYSEMEDLRLRIQLLVCFVFPLQKYRNRLYAYNNLHARFKLLSDSVQYRQDLAILQIFALESLSTHDVNRKLREEIIPAMLKTQKFNPMKFGIDKIEDIDETNPEWGSVDKTIGELAELEAKGADVYYSTFAPLKRFPFFNEEANWFYPYDLNHPSVPSRIRNSGGKGIMQTLLNSDVLCDSDKYSFCLLTTQMTEQQVGLLASQIPGYDDVEQDKKNTPEVVCRNYMRVLFRYFYLYGGARPSNPFEEDFTLINNSVLGAALTYYDTLMRIGSYAMENKNYPVASVYMEKCTEFSNADAEAYQKLGYCCQKNKQTLDAMKAYEKAYSLNGKSKWTLRHLAHTNLFAGNYKEAFDYYRLLEAFDEKDAKVAFRCGECLVRLGKYSEAIKEFYKAEYLVPENLAAARAVAWCSVLTGDIKQARRYYAKIVSVNSTADDLISAGHAAWIDGDASDAATLYSRAAEKSEAGDFCRKFFADSEILAAHGIKHEDVLLMADLAVMGTH